MTHPDNDNHPGKDDHDTDAPYARKAERETGKPDQLKDKVSKSESRQDALQDEAVERPRLRERLQRDGRLPVNWRHVNVGLSSRAHTQKAASKKAGGGIGNSGSYAATS